MNEYHVTIGFGGFIGCTKEYVITASCREDAEEMALLQAQDDLNVEDVDSDDDGYDEWQDEDEWNEDFD